MVMKKCKFLNKINGTSFDAGYRTFKIIVKDNLSSEQVPCWGTTDFDSCIIHLDSSASESTAKESLVHEITHVLLEFVGFGGYDSKDTGPQDGFIRDTNNELLTTSVSRAFLLALRLNPELFRILIGE